MPSFQTIFRAVVMVAVGAVAVKGWHLYGPTNEQVKSAVAQAVEYGAVGNPKPAAGDNGRA